MRKLTGEAGAFSGESHHDMDELFGRGAFTGSVSVSCIRKGDEVVGALAVGAADVLVIDDGRYMFLDYIAEAIGQLPARQ